MSVLPVPLCTPRGIKTLPYTLLDQTYLEVYPYPRGGLVANPSD
jgi:hypothetical protein